MSTKKGPGRPPVDSDLVRARMPRDLLDALDAYIMDLPVGTTRPDALRLAFRDWATAHGYLLTGPAQEDAN